MRLCAAGFISSQRNPRYCETVLGRSILTNGNAATGNVNSWGNYQIGGGAANQSAAYIDGAPVNISYVNSTIIVPTQEAIQEFRVESNNGSAQECDGPLILGCFPEKDEFGLDGGHALGLQQQVAEIPVTAPAA
jgi:hypothetical protein